MAGRVARKWWRMEGRLLRGRVPLVKGLKGGRGEGVREGEG